MTARILCDIQQIRRRIIDLRQRAFHRRDDVFARDVALSRLGKGIAARDGKIIARVVHAVGDVMHRAALHVLVVVGRCRRIERHVTFEVNPRQTAVKRDLRVGQIVFNICRCTAADMLNGRIAVIDLRCIAKGKVDRIGIDRPLGDCPRAVERVVELIVARIAAERCSHRAMDAAVLDGLVRAGVRIGGKGPARAHAVVARDACRRRELIRSVDKTTLICVEHSRIGSRNRRRDRRIRRRAIIGLRHRSERHRHLALLNRIVGRRIGCHNRRAIDLDRIVACIRRIGRDGIVHGSIARARILIHIDRRRRILVAADESLERDEIICARNDLARTVLRRAIYCRLRVVGLGERSVDRRVHGLRRDDAGSRRRERRSPSDGKVAVTAARIVGQLVGDALRCTVIDICRRIIDRRADRHAVTNTHRRPVHDDGRGCDIVLDIRRGSRLVVLDRLCPVVDLRRLPRRKGDIARRNVQRRDLAESPGRRCEIIVSRIRAAKRKPRVVDPVLLLCAARGCPLCAVAVHVFALELLRMTAQRHVVAGNDCAGCKGDLRSGDILRPVVDFGHLGKCARKVLRRDFARRGERQPRLGVHGRSVMLKGIVRSVAARERDPVRDILIDNRAAEACDVLIRYAAVHIVRRDAEARSVVDEFQRSAPIGDIARAVRIGQRVPLLRCRIDKSGRAVIDFINAAVLYEAEAQHAPCDLALARDVRLSRFEVLPVQRIVLQQIAVTRIRRDIHLVRNACGIGDVHRIGHIVAFLELRISGGKIKMNMIAVRPGKPIRAPGLELRAGRYCVVRRTVVDLRRLSCDAASIDDLEIIWRDGFTVNSPLAVGVGLHLVVVLRRAEGVLKRPVHSRIANVVRCAVARVGVLLEGRTRAAPVVTLCRACGMQSIPRRFERRFRDAVVGLHLRDHGGGRFVRDRRDIARRVVRCRVIGLRNVAHRQLELSLCDRSHICDRAEGCSQGPVRARSGQRADDRIPRIDDLVVVDVLPSELCRICHALFLHSARRVDGDMLIRIDGGRRIDRRTARLIRDDRPEVYNVIARDLIPVPVRMFVEPVIDLRDLLAGRPNLGRGNRPRRRRMGGIRIIHGLQIARRA